MRRLRLKEAGQENNRAVPPKTLRHPPRRDVAYRIVVAGDEANVRQDLRPSSVDQHNGDALPFGLRRAIRQRNRNVSADDKAVHPALQKLGDVASLSRGVEPRVAHRER
jgi:hypothetical protein